MLNYLLGRLFELILGRERAVECLAAWGQPSVAWELESAYGLRKMRSDSTCTYTFEFALHEFLRAELAFKARSFEWAFVNVADALAVIEWKGEQDDPLCTKAMSLKARASKHIAPERLEDLAAEQEKIKLKHYSLDELQFMKKLKSKNMSLWKQSFGFAGRPKLSVRP